MDLSDVPLFALADRRLAWVDARQSVLARNIANADTPHFQASDVTPFSAALARAGVQLERTEPGHLAAPNSDGGIGIAQQVTERAPDGNSVAIDKELAKIADTDQAHELVTSLTKKYLGFVRTAIGR